jgi:hypothetical protein
MIEAAHPIVMLCAAFVISVSFAVFVNVASAGMLPVSPIKICPFVGAAVLVTVAGVALA